MTLSWPLLLGCLGWAGAVGTAAAYLLVSRRRWAPDALRLQGVNAVGAAFLALSASAHGAWASALSNLVWMAIGSLAIVSVHRGRHAVTQPSGSPTLSTGFSTAVD